MPARIVIASYDQVLKEVLSRNISGSNIQVDLAYNIVQSEAYFSSSEPNVLIFDIDNGTAPSRYISLLLEKYNLLIVLTGSDPKKAFDFYKYGVKDYIIKPKKFNSADGRELIVAVTERIKKFFSVVNDSRTNTQRTPSHSSRFMQNRFIANGSAMPHANRHSYPNSMHNQMATSKLGHNKNDSVIAIAASTGGPDALDSILRNLPVDLPPILIVQHMPSKFTYQFAQRINNYSKLEIKEAEDGEPVYSGYAYIAPGGLHMIIKKMGGQLCIKCIAGKKVNGVCPAADVLFSSVAEVMADRAIGVILTGMGADGAKGLSIMKSAGSVNIGQDKETSVVYGMPRVAYDLNCLDYQLSLDRIPQKIVDLSKKFQ